jgi:hypothetical protein
VAKTKRVGGGEERRGEERRRGLTLSYFITARFLEGHLKKWKEMVRTWQDQAPPLFCPNRERAL